MKILFCIFILFVALEVQAQDTSKWMVIAPEGDDYTLLMPQPISVIKRDVRVGDGLGIVIPIYESEEKGISFFAFSFEKYKQFGQPIILKKFETIGEGLHYSLLNGTAKGNINITDKKEFRLNGRRVKEFSFQHGEKIGVARLYEGDEKYVALVVLGMKDKQTDLKIFFESFHFTAANATLNNETSAIVKKLTADDPTIKPALWKIDAPRDYKKTVVNRGFLNNRILNPKEVKPDLSPNIKVRGEVKLKLLVDESGKVISAEVIEGHPLLKASAIKTAMMAKFEPMMLSGNPIKFDGWIIVKFQD